MPNLDDAINYVKQRIEVALSSGASERQVLSMRLDLIRMESQRDMLEQMEAAVERAANKDSSDIPSMRYWLCKDVSVVEAEFTGNLCAMGGLSSCRHCTDGKVPLFTSLVDCPYCGGEK